MIECWSLKSMKNVSLFLILPVRAPEMSHRQGLSYPVSYPCLYSSKPIDL